MLADLAVRVGDSTFVLLVACAVGVCGYFAAKLATAIAAWLIERSDRRGW